MTLLDNHLRICAKPDAVFKTTEIDLASEILETYSPEYAAAAETLAKTASYNALGLGEDNQKQVIAGVTLTWFQNAWISEGIGHSLEIDGSGSV